MKQSQSDINQLIDMNDPNKQQTKMGRPQHFMRDPNNVRAIHMLYNKQLFPQSVYDNHPVFTGRPWVASPQYATMNPQEILNGAMKRTQQQPIISNQSNTQTTNNNTRIHPNMSNQEIYGDTLKNQRLQAIKRLDSLRNPQAYPKQSPLIQQ